MKELFFGKFSEVLIVVIMIVTAISIFGYLVCVKCNFEKAEKVFNILWQAFGFTFLGIIFILWAFSVAG